MMNDTRVRNGYEPVNYRQGYFPTSSRETETDHGTVWPGSGDRDRGHGATHHHQRHDPRLPARYPLFGNAQERLGFNTAYDAVEGLRPLHRGCGGMSSTRPTTSNGCGPWQRRSGTGRETRGYASRSTGYGMTPTLDDEDKRNRIEKIVEDGRFTLSNFVVDLDEYPICWQTKEPGGPGPWSSGWAGHIQRGTGP